jgi:hypothetical protein
VRGRRAGKAVGAAGKAAVNVQKARQTVRVQLKRMMPKIIQEEISAYLKLALK